MATTVPVVERSAAIKPVVTKIVGKFQVTIPPEIREIYDLREGDLLEWNFDARSSQLLLFPKRAQLLTPQLEEEISNVKARRARERRAALKAQIDGR